jgi:chromosome segregation ATPase
MENISMYPEEQEMSNLKLEIGLMKKDNQQLTTITNKLSDSIDKIQEMNSNLLRMISLHDQKHESHTRTENELKEDIKELHSRITTTTRELHERIDEVEKHISSKIDSLRIELKQHEQNDNRGGGISELIKEIDKYKWMILGGVFAVGWLIGNVNLGVLGTLIK